MTRTIVCFGDSNTHGYDSKTGGRFDEKHRWPCLLQKDLGEQYLVREEGLCGRTTAFEDPLMESLSGVETIFPVLMTHEPVDLLLIMLGTNDTKEHYAATPENIGSALRRLIRKAKAVPEAFRDSAPNILIICPPPILPVYAKRIFAGEMGKGASEKSIALPEIFRTVSGEEGCHYINAGELPGVSMSENYCGMHMETASHARLAAALAEKVQEILA